MESPIFLEWNAVQQKGKGGHVPEDQLPFQFAMQPRYRTQDFLKSGSNAFALGAVEAWPQWPSYGLVIFGSSKVGKTHLAHIFQNQSHAHFLQKENLVDLAHFEGMIQPESAYVLEDVYPWVNQNEQALFHLCNILKERDCTLLITAERPPALWGLTLADLESRLSLFPAIEIERPDDSLLEAILVKKISEMQVDLNPTVQKYILTHTERSADAVIRLLEELDHRSLKAQKSMTIPLVKEIMLDFSSLQAD